MSQERLRCDGEFYDRLPRFCAHGTTLTAWNDTLSGSRSLNPGGPHRRRAAAHFAVSLPGDTGRIVSMVLAYT